METSAAGFHTELWTCPRVVEVIKQRFGIDYHGNHVGRLLPDLGWSPQKPARRAAGRDKQKIRRWVEEDRARVRNIPSRTLLMRHSLASRSLISYAACCATLTSKVHCSSDNVVGIARSDRTDSIHGTIAARTIESRTRHRSRNLENS
ncbi:MAG: winged helix-turn-helix domain-containing protein [Burkholderiales bacterium]|nr:winged helix-turn-helix domain-containing protein [Burkholderiales bacterium]